MPKGGICVAREAIRRTWSQQERYLQVDEVVVTLYENGIIGKMKRDQIFAECEPLARRRLLLQELEGKTTENILTYCDILEWSCEEEAISRHGEIAKAIRAAIEELAPSLSATADFDTRLSMARSRLTTEETVRALYEELKGKAFVGTYVEDWESPSSPMPALRQVITVPQTQLGQQLHTRMSHINEQLEGQVWKGFVLSGSRWKFYVTLDGDHEIGDTGLCEIKAFEVFPVSEHYHQYASGLGVSITVTMVRGMLVGSKQMACLALRVV